MMDYSRYRTCTLEKMREAAWKKYHEEAMKSPGGWGDGMRLSKLPQFKAWEKTKERYESIDRELKQRKKGEL